MSTSALNIREQLAGLSPAKRALIELKLASGMTSAGRLKDLGDVQELIKTLDLPRDFADELHAFVRDKYVELWDGVHHGFEDV